MVLRVDANDVAELQALVRTLKSVEKPVASAIRAGTRAGAKVIWEEEMKGRSQTVFEARFAGTARVQVSDQNVTLQAAKVRGQKFRNGLDLRQSWPEVERGANREKRTTYSRRSKNGGTHQVTRRTMTQFRPRNRAGYVAGPAQKASIGRVVSMWVQTAMYVIFTGIERH
ncbi:hypothetical protein DOE76_13935 [Leifsonia sp. ku-ls]|nr:hypothetical protein DOE76_13935 [Leifsonia sp. ku-ls]